MADYQNYPYTILLTPAERKRLEILEKRLRDRGTETEESIQARLQTAKEEIKNKKIYPHIVINEDGKVIEAAKEIYEIIKND